MAPAADYLFLSIETFVNTISLIVVIPCITTLVRAQGIHGNCKALLVTSACVQAGILVVQTALFAHNFITENLLPVTDDMEMPFLVAQNTLFTMSSYLSMVLVLERVYAVRNAVAYEKSGRHLLQLLILIGGTLVMGGLHAYAIYWHDWFFQTIFVLYGIQGFSVFISSVMIVYARWKIRKIPFDDERLNAMYQASLIVREVLKFSMAILPSVIVSAIMHTLSLIPTLLWVSGVISYPVCCVFYFSAHSFNCILTKLMLIACHKGMRDKFLLLFGKTFSTSKDVRVHRDTDREAKEYFDQLKSAWDASPRNM